MTRIPYRSKTRDEIYESDLKCLRNRQEMAYKFEVDLLVGKGNIFYDNCHN